MTMTATTSTSRTLKISRKNWARAALDENGRIVLNWQNNGLAASMNRLINANGRRSALGFMLEQFGDVPEEKLKEHGYPFAVGVGTDMLAEGADPRIPTSYPAQIDIMHVNNREREYREIDNEEQERLIAEKLVAVFGERLGFDRVEFED